MQYFKVRNWEKFQHYKDRAPPWIKLHFSLLSSQDWVMLDDASKLLAIVCMLIASRNEGLVPDDPDYLARVAYLKRVNLQPLVNSGFLIPVLADASKCKQEQANVTTEKRRVEKSRDRVETEADSDASASAFLTPEELLKTYHEICTDLPKVLHLTHSRKIHAAARLKEHSEIEFWQGFFRRVARSDFLCGRAPPKGDGRPFKADFEWLIKQANFVKVCEGRYDNREAVKQKTWLEKQQEKEQSERVAGNE